MPPCHKILDNELAVENRPCQRDERRSRGKQREDIPDILNISITHRCVPPRQTFDPWRWADIGMRLNPNFPDAELFTAATASLA